MKAWVDLAYLPMRFPEDETPGDRPLSGGLLSPLFSNMALKFLTWLMMTMKSGVGWFLFPGARAISRKRRRQK